MLVVADATPLHYLVLIGEIDLLQQLYGAVPIPSGVISELSVREAPASVRSWIASPPSWISVASPSGSVSLPFPRLGRGEREGIALAIGDPGSILLTDDSAACFAAEECGIRVVPTIRLLSTAHELPWSICMTHSNGYAQRTFALRRV